MNYLKLIALINILFFLLFFSASSEVIKKIEISGNERISKETILMFSNVDIDDDLGNEQINEILKNLYNSSFFEDVSVKFESNNLNILVKENPIIENIIFNGIKSKTLKEEISKNLKLISRSSYNEILLKKDKEILLSELKNSGYYFSEVDIELLQLENNKVDLNYNITLGDKAKIKRISFIGDKKYKDGKLKSIIISEEYKFWKIISGKKYLNEQMINFDTRLLNNFYLNKGYYDVEINSSFAKLLEKDQFELIYNINAKNKFFLAI